MHLTTAVRAPTPLSSGFKKGFQVLIDGYFGGLLFMHAEFNGQIFGALDSPLKLSLVLIERGPDTLRNGVRITGYCGCRAGIAPGGFEEGLPPAALLNPFSEKPKKPAKSVDK
jgi:hypothetical protein